LSAGLAESQSPKHPWETPVGLARGAGDGDWRRLYPAPPAMWVGDLGWSGDVVVWRARPDASRVAALENPHHAVAYVADRLV